MHQRPSKEPTAPPAPMLTAYALALSAVGTEKEHRPRPSIPKAGRQRASASTLVAAVGAGDGSRTPVASLTGGG